MFACFDRNGVFADPDDCQCYYECANLIPSRMCCAAGEWCWMIDFSDN